MTTRSATVTILFTDLVGSTELSERLGDEGAQEMRRTHFQLLRDVVAAHGGHEVKNLGDGLMVVFQSALDAVSCGAAMQRAVGKHNREAREEERITVRVGLHVGEPIREEEDYFGVPVAVAKRVCDSAQGGEIVATDLIRGLVAGRGNFVFEDLGERSLKGLSEPMQLFSVRSEGVAAAISPIPLPPLLEHTTRTVFVARDVELSRIEEVWLEVSKGTRRLVLVAGEPGIGKTRLVAEFARTAHAAGATVLFGRSDEETLVPYQPFVEALSYYIDSCPLPELQAQAADTAGVATLVPELAQRIPSLPHASSGDPETERYRLFESVTTLLGAVSADVPLVFLLDDLHWADRPSLLLLRHIMRSAGQARLMFLGTYRETDLARTHPLADMLADLRREQSYQRIALRGLDESGVDAMVDAWAGHEAPRVFTRAVHEQTEGNPFFIEEVLAHLREAGVIYQRDGRWVSDAQSVDALGIPEGIREVIGRRLSRLSEECNAVLAHAAVLGREFEFATLTAMTGLGEDTVLRAVEEALAARLIQEAQGRDTATYAFTHALVRQTLYEELALPRKQKLHLRAAETIEAQVNRAMEPYLPALASHYRLAGAAADARKAIEYSIKAGEAAERVFAYEEAAAHWQAALELLEEQDAPKEERARLLERLGDLLYVGGLDYERGITTVERALALYEELGNTQRVAQMHSRLGRDMSTGAGDMSGRTNIPRALEHFRQAEELVAGGPESPALAYVYIGTGAACLWAMDAQRGLDVTRRAMDIAERLGNEAIHTNAAILHGHFLVHIGRISEGLSLLDDMWNVGDRLNHAFLGFLATWVRAGMVARPEHERERIERELSRPRSSQAPSQRRALLDLLAVAYIQVGEASRARQILAETGVEGMQAQHALLVHDGAWDEAEELSKINAERGKQAGNRYISCASLGNIGHLNVFRGAIAQSEEAYRESLSEMGATRDVTRTVPMAYLADLCAEGGRLEEAKALLRACRELLPEPAEDSGYEGGILRATACVLAAEGDLERAERTFAEALRQCQAQGYLVVSRTLMAWSRWLSRAGERARADEKFDEAAEIYRSVGVGQPWFDRLEQIRRGE